MLKIQKGQTDKSGNYRDLSRETEGYFEPKEDKPFACLVTAWYPKSQTIDVIRPVGIGYTEYNGVIVYGNFFDENGTIHTPKIGTTKKTDGYTTILDSNQTNPNSEQYVLNNHIEALVFRIESGYMTNEYGYAASSFRFLRPESSLINNAKTGRRISRHDDGSFYIHDDDGNIQFNHPSGLNLKIGSILDDIELDEAFPAHERNLLLYDNQVKTELKIPSEKGDILILFDGAGSFKIEHPSGSFFEIDGDGALILESFIGSFLKLKDDGTFELDLSGFLGAFFGVDNLGKFDLKNNSATLKDLFLDLITIVNNIDAAVNSGANASLIAALTLKVTQLLK